MKRIKIENMELIALDSREMQDINGGNSQAYDLGHSIGAYLKNIADGVGICALIYCCL